MIKKIALEEHFLCPALEEYWKATVEDVAPDILVKVVARLSDFGDLRLETMDRAGIERSVLSIAGPGVQAERDAIAATRRARDANDLLAREIKFAGAMINGHTNGQYLDDPALHPFWERAEALGALIYLHPADPVSPYPVLAGHKALTRATWGWGVETGSHALRLVFGGHFDRFPKARLVLGHLGETLPYLLWRFDSRAKLYGVKLAKLPSEYIRQNIILTTSGMFSREPLICALDALGRDKVLFSADYPFESSEAAAEFMDGVAIDDGLRADVAYNNAAGLLGLDAPGH